MWLLSYVRTNDQPDPRVLSCELTSTNRIPLVTNHPPSKYGRACHFANTEWLFLYLIDTCKLSSQSYTSHYRENQYHMQVHYRLTLSSCESESSTVILDFGHHEGSIPALSSSVALLSFTKNLFLLAWLLKYWWSFQNDLSSANKL